MWIRSKRTRGPKGVSETFWVDTPDAAGQTEVGLKIENFPVAYLILLFEFELNPFRVI